MYSVLVCDDDHDIVAALKIYLSSEGYEVRTAYRADEAIEIIRSGGAQLALLDVMMPEKDGITALAEIRAFSNIPVILLTAKSEDTDKVLGLNVGADDYMTKPFNPIEVTARVRSQLRRYMKLGGASMEPEAGANITIGGIELNDSEKSVTLDGEPVSLTPTEYSVLKLLMESPGKVFSSKEIYEKIWKGPSFGSESTVSVHIRHLREKLEISPAEPRFIKVVWGQGYKMEKK